MELPECFKKTVLIEALPDCMESDRAALYRFSTTVSLQTLKTEVKMAGERFLRRHGGKQGMDTPRNASSVEEKVTFLLKATVKGEM